MNYVQAALIGLFFAAAGLLGAPSSAQAAEEIIGYVNLQRAIRETEDGKQAQAKLKKTFEVKQSALRKKEEDLEAMKNRLQNAGLKQDDPEARAQVLSFQKKFLALRETLIKEQKELKALEDKELSRITKQLRKIIKAMGKEGGYTLIIEAQETGVLFAKPHLDLTNELIRKYNLSARKKKGGRKK